jgi:hypothetical protein
MEWYLPMTIIPGVGLIIMSTSHMLMGLSNEITVLEEATRCRVDIIKAKLGQLKRLSVALVFQYLAVLFLLFSGIIKSTIPEINMFTEYLLIFGIVALTSSIILLLIYSLKAVSIRQNHLELRTKEMKG